MAGRRLFYERELTEYPVGGRRIWLLFIAILANFVASYEAQISPVLPLLMRDLHMTLGQYGEIASISVVASAVSAMIFGPLADRYGRVRFLVPSLFLTAACVYGMVLVHSVTGLFIARIILAFIEGVAIASTAGQVRDFSPRTGRALAFGFWTFGPVGSNFFANAVAGATLPIFHTWQSQFVIEGTVALAACILILFTIHDLSPQLRAKVIDSVQEVDAVNQQVRRDRLEEPKMREILRVPHVWTLTIGISLFLLTYLTIQSFGTTFLVQAFHYDTSQAAAIAKYFWLLNLATLLIAGWISDRLRLRKIVSFVGAVLSVLYMFYFVSLVGQTIPEGQMILYTSLLGGLFGVAYGPWCALFSENAEDIKPSLQSAAWGLFGFVIRVAGIAVALCLPVVVAMGGWGVWLTVSAVGGLIYIPLVFTAKGPWFRFQRPMLPMSESQVPNVDE
ncbi:MAG: MFS transporter [Alicyclobacillus macrosporangiidus]|uniref:MFS transporter n=1 Tax=Alicyclobacillus macrosporangiidus TaxID=392015 RepID=UPI0026EA6DD5|nr:MFS transporter [Alicyclobacillus macrosporangiidus]MCL6599832.1 MFS transporter [Alicyclobacillus macrosporangiidus]